MNFSFDYAIASGLMRRARDFVFKSQRTSVADHFSLAFTAASRGSRPLLSSHALSLNNGTLCESSGLDIHGEIFDAVIADHFRFADLRQSGGGSFQLANRRKLQPSAGLPR